MTGSDNSSLFSSSTTQQIGSQKRPSEGQQPRQKMGNNCCWHSSSRLLLSLALLVALLLVLSPPASAFPHGLGQPGEEAAWRGAEASNPWAAAMQSPLEEEQLVGGAEPLRAMEKRRLVVRVPFAQNPDGHQLSRIYKSLFEPSNSRAKKQPWSYSFRHFGAEDEQP